MSIAKRSNLPRQGQNINNRRCQPADSDTPHFISPKGAAQRTETTFTLPVGYRRRNRPEVDCLPVPPTIFAQQNNFNEHTTI